MSVDSWLARIETGLTAQANPVRAASMQAYLRHQFPFLGIAAPVRRAVINQLGPLDLNPAELLELSERLWTKPEREYCYTAIDLLKTYRSGLSLVNKDVIQQRLQDRAWWDSVDGLTGLIGALVRQERPAGNRWMDDWLSAPDFWLRRSAMIHQLGFRQHTDDARLFDYARQLAPEPEFFIRKAIGWALRDRARTAPEAVLDFVAQQGSRLSALSRREACKRLLPSIHLRVQTFAHDSGTTDAL